MIPKKIHYCWFGGKPLPKSALKCIESWHKYLPDYEIVRWDESNFDVNSIPYTAEAYKAKKYAFVSDYARFYILYHEGGIYFDTDVEVIRPFDDIIAKGPFMGCEHRYKENGTPEDLGVAPGLGLGVEAGHLIIKELLKNYEGLHYILSDGSANKDNIVIYTSKCLCKFGLRNTPMIQSIEGIHIYPVDYFCPISTEDGRLRITQNTRSIHHYDQSWQSPLRNYGRKLILKLGGVQLKDSLKSLLIGKQ